MWTRRAAEAHLAQVLAIAEEALPVLGLVDDDTAPGEVLNKRVKFLMETALLLQAVHRSASLPSDLRHRALEIGRAVAPFVRHDRLSSVFLLKPSVASEYAVAHGCLTAMGLPDERFQRSVEVALAAPVARSFQRLPWKELELAWAESVLDVADPASRPEAARPLTFLSRGLDLLGSSRKEMYHLTHEVIYASDFGLLRFEPPRPLAEVLRDVDGAIVRTLDDDDFDLCAELLLVAPYAGAAWSPTALFGLTAVMDVVERFGALPSMTFHPTSSTATTAAERRLYFLEESYHTQYVLGFLMLATLLPGATPPVPPPGPPPVATLPARLSQSPAFWETTSAVPPSDVLVDVAVLRAYAQRDFRLLGALLDAHPRPVSRVVEQAADTLVRLSSYSRAH